MKPRVAYQVSRFPKTSETFIVDEITALEEAGVEVALYALAPGRRAVVGPDAARLAARCHRLPALSPRLLFAELAWLGRAPLRLAGVWARVLARHARSPRALVRAVVAVAHAVAHARDMQRSGVGHVHAHWATHTALAAWAIHRLTGLSYSFTAHADDLFVARPMLEEKVRDAAFVVTVSEYNRAYLRRRVAAAARTPVEVVRCGVRADAFGPAPGPKAGDPFTVVCVARLEPKKGHVHLLDAIALLVQAGVDVRCRLIGEGRCRRALEAQIERLGLGDRVRVEGARPRDAVREAIAAAHVFVLPSIVDVSGRADGIPVVLMEAMAMERPVVSTRVSGIPELVEHDVGGWLVPPGDPAALAEAIDRVRREPERAAGLARAGRARVLADYALEASARRLRELFMRTAGEARGRDRAEEAA